MSSETTYVMVKPDGVQRSFVGEIIQRFERKGLQLVGLKQIIPTEDIAKKHYDVHSDKPFFPGLIKFITSGPVVCMAWSGKDAISVARNLIGPTNGREASPGTIRGDYGMDIGYNMIHGSDAAETAESELNLWFPDGLNEWKQDSQSWVYE
tara:strand:+ start:802 stop:1254 length:453 start_codon:yes stop_codon:yes gene_type:complete